jgi:hypothetical protein
MVRMSSAKGARGDGRTSAARATRGLGGWGSTAVMCFQSAACTGRSTGTGNRGGGGESVYVRVCRTLSQTPSYSTENKSAGKKNNDDTTDDSTNTDRVMSVLVRAPFVGCSK